MTNVDESGPERRAQLTADLMARNGIDEPMIERFVRLFYQRIQTEPVLGPIFAAKVSDWEYHIAKLCAFWSSVALMTGRYHGQPMRMHMDLPVGRAHFDRWLELFEMTAVEICPPVAAAHLVERARRIADSLELGIATAQGRIEMPRHSRPQRPGDKTLPENHAVQRYP